MFMYGEHNRFTIEHFKGITGDKVWIVRDAEWNPVLSEGHRSPAVALFFTFEEAVEFCDKAEDGEIQTWPHDSAMIGWPELRERVIRAEQERSRWKGALQAPSCPRPADVGRVGHRT